MWQNFVNLITSPCQKKTRLQGRVSSKNRIAPQKVGQRGVLHDDRTNNLWTQISISCVNRTVWSAGRIAALAVACNRRKVW